MEYKLNLENIKLGDEVALKICGFYDHYLVFELKNENENMLSDEYGDFYFNKDDSSILYFKYGQEYDNQSLYNPNCEQVIRANKIYKAHELMRYIQEDIHKIRLNELKGEDLEDIVKDLNNVTSWF